MPRTSDPHPQTVAGNLAALPPALAPLCDQKRWLVWRWTRGKNGKWTKPPFRAAQPDQHAANNDPETWSDHGAAAAAVSAGHAHGIGFALPGSDISAVDLDRCRNIDGTLDAWAQAIVDSAPGAYLEVTVSGTGVRIIGTGAGAPVHRKFTVRNGREGAAVELYRGAIRYITVSGTEIGNCNQVGNIDGLIDSLLAEHDRAEHGRANGGAKANGAGANGDDDIDRLIRNGAPEGQRSEAFNRVIWSLAATGASVDEIVTELERYPGGIAEKYAGRLAVEVERCWRKWAQCRSNDRRGDRRQADGENTATLRRANTIKPESIDWAWPNRFAFGKLALLAGDPGLGKSSLLFEIAALHSIGGAFPCGEGNARRCEAIVLTAEDGLADTVVPRLMAAGADLSKVHILTGTKMANSEVENHFDLTRDVAALRRALADHPNVKVLIIDPLTAYLGATNAKENAEIRNALAPLVKLIEEAGVLCIGNTHLNKREGTKAAYRILDSIAFTAVGRLVHLVIKDADNPDNRKFICDKTNIGHRPLGLTFIIQPHDITSSKGEVIGTSRICWGTSYIDETADQAMTVDDKNPTMTDAAVEFLKIVLADGPMAVADIEREAWAARELSESQHLADSKPFRSACRRLGIVTRKLGLEGGWQWSLPSQDRR